MKVFLSVEKYVVISMWKGSLNFENTWLKLPEYGELTDSTRNFWFTMEIVFQVSLIVAQTGSKPYHKDLVRNWEFRTVSSDFLKLVPDFLLNSFSVLS